MKRLKFISARTLISCMIFCLVFLLSSCSCFAEGTVTLPQQKYVQLITLLNQQESQFQLLENKTKLLNLTSPQLVEQLATCQVELKKAQETLIQSQEKLAKSQESLVNAEKEIYTLKLSLSRLEAQIRNELSIRKRKRIQTGIWCTLGGFAVGSLVK